jgi:RND family efflux transporter MFP subunit
VVQVKPPEVIYATPAVENVADYEEFTGRVTAYRIVDVRARVTGHLKRVLFKDGDVVRAGTPLFDLDPALYMAELERAKAAVKQAIAKADRLARDEKRVRDLPRSAVSQEEVDRVAGELAEARAGVEVAEAQKALAQQNVDYTHIAAPISGHIGKRAIDEGNLVKADDTLLATIVAIDKVYADFDVDDRTQIKLVRSGRLNTIRKGETQVRIGLPDEDGFSRTGTVTFIDNKLNPGTGTIGMRAEVQNPDGLIEPGLFLRIRIPLGDPKPSILVPETAIGTDQGLKYVFVIGPDDAVQYRRVKVGQQVERKRAKGDPIQFRVVEPVEKIEGSGVREGERVIVEGLQRVRAGSKVTPKPQPPSAQPPAVSGSPTPQPPTTPAGSQ